MEIILSVIVLQKLNISHLYIINIIFIIIRVKLRVINRGKGRGF